MMNVLNSAVAPRTDSASASSSSSGKSTRSTGDDGFSKTLNSYGDTQDRGSKSSRADNDDRSASAAQSGQAKDNADPASGKDAAGADAAGATKQGAFTQAAPVQDGQAEDTALVDIAIEIPADAAAQTPPVDATDAGTDAAADLLAELQAAMPTKGQAGPARTNTTDQSKADKTDADDADADTTAEDATTGDMLAILQAVPDAAAVQSDVPVDPQQATQPQAETIETKIDTNIPAIKADASDQSLQLAISDTTSKTATTPTTPDASRTAKQGAAGAETAAAVQDALQHDDDVSTDIEMPAITVTENRRYVGLAPSSNALSLATAFGRDPDWSAAMDPSAKLSNEALYASTGKVVNTLKLELNPNGLGHVTATMRMVGEELNIHLTVESSKAYKQIASDSSSILDSLKAHGYSVDQITVTIASGGGSTTSDKGNDPSANGRQSSDMGQAQQQQQQGGRQGSTFGSSMSDGSDTAARGSSSGGNDEGLAQGSAGGRTDSRPDHVYL